MSGIRLSGSEVAKLRAMAKTAPILGSKKIAAKLMIEVYDDSSHRLMIPPQRDTQFALLGRILVGILMSQFGGIVEEAKEEAAAELPAETEGTDGQAAGE